MSVREREDYLLEPLPSSGSSNIDRFHSILAEQGVTMIRTGVLSSSTVKKNLKTTKKFVLYIKINIQMHDNFV